MISEEKQAQITWRARYDAAKKHRVEFNDPPPDEICTRRIAWDKAEIEAEKEFNPDLVV